MKRSTSLALGLASFFVLAGPAAAQTSSIDFSGPLATLDQAVMGLAASSIDFQADLKDVARLHEHVVALWPAGDHHRFSCLMDQASFLVGLKDFDGARTYVEAAIAEAESTGAVMAAAEASITGAWLAQQLGDKTATREFRIKARTLATSPELTTTQSNEIALRLYGKAWIAAATGQSVLIDD